MVKITKSDNGIIVLVVGFLFVIAVVILSSLLPLVFDIGEAEVPTIDTSKHNMLKFEDNYRGSNPGAKIEFVLFSDFTCPACIEQYTTYKKLIEDYPEVNFIHKFMVGPNQELAFYAAKAYECSNRQGKEHEISDYLYINKFKGIDVEREANNLGLDMELFKNCTNSEAMDRLIIADANHGSFLEVKGTPTIFINGIKIEGVHNYEVYASFINQEKKSIMKNE